MGVGRGLSQSSGSTQDGLRAAEGEQGRIRLLAAEPAPSHRGPLRDALRRGPRAQVPEAPAGAQGVHARLEADRRRGGAARRPGPRAGLHLRAASPGGHVRRAHPKTRAPPRRGFLKNWFLKKKKKKKKKS